VTVPGLLPFLVLAVAVALYSAAVVGERGVSTPRLTNHRGVDTPRSPGFRRASCTLRSEPSKTRPRRRGTRMALKLPEPPPGSRFVADADEQGRPRLNWADPLALPNLLAGFVFTGAVGGWLFCLIRLVIEDWAGLGANAARPVPVREFVIHLVAACVVGMLFLCFNCALIALLVRGPTPRRITFGPDALHFEPALTDSQFRMVKEVPRGELGAIGLRPRQGRQALTVDRGVQRLEVGFELTDPERAWLAGVLHAWADRPEGDAGALRPPHGSSIRVEDDAGAWRLSWQPSVGPLASGFERWATIIGLTQMLLVWLAITTVLKFVCGGMLLQQLVGGGGWVAAALLALLVLFTMGGMGPVRHALAEIRRLLAEPRPESVTLSATTLTHDPGNFLRHPVADDAPRAIPLDEIDAVNLPAAEGPLVLVHGGQQRFLGRCLHEPEREWLAEVLRRWVAKDSAAPLATG